MYTWATADDDEEEEINGGYRIKIDKWRSLLTGVTIPSRTNYTVDRCNFSSMAKRQLYAIKPLFMCNLII